MQMVGGAVEVFSFVPPTRADQERLHQVVGTAVQLGVRRVGGPERPRNCVVDIAELCEHVAADPATGQIAGADEFRERGGGSVVRFGGGFFGMIRGLSRAFFANSRTDSAGMGPYPGR